MNKHLLALGDKLFIYAYPVYLPLYSAYKVFSDRRERALMKSMIKPGMNIVDVGANIGILSRFFSKLTLPDGHVHAFEPSPSNYTRLRENVAGLQNVTAINAAVGAAGGTIGLYLSDSLNVDHHTYDDGSSRRRIDVPLIALDDHFPAGTKVDFLKVDVQGYELSVLQGAARILRENHDIRGVIEYWPYGLTKAGADPRELLQFLRSMELDARVSDGRALGEFSAGRESDYCNIIIGRSLE